MGGKESTIDSDVDVQDPSTSKEKCVFQKVICGIFFLSQHWIVSFKLVAYLSYFQLCSESQPNFDVESIFGPVSRSKIP